jgi:hypothetical protein
MNNRWFWENKLMGWFEGKLLTFTNWFWNKRHQPPPLKNEPHLGSTTKSTVKKAPAKKAPAKKTPAKKKSDWNVK